MTCWKVRRANFWLKELKTPWGKGMGGKNLRVLIRFGFVNSMINEGINVTGWPSVTRGSRQGWQFPKRPPMAAPHGHRRAAKVEGTPKRPLGFGAGTNQSSVERLRATACYIFSLVLCAIIIVVWRFINIQALFCG